MSSKKVIDFTSIDGYNFETKDQYNSVILGTWEENKRTGGK
jgi:hypothetical protein